MHPPKLEMVFAWLGFGMAQVPGWIEWFEAHPHLADGLNKVFWTVVCATLYHFVLKYWKKKDKGDA